MRNRITFPADEILARAHEIEVKVYRNNTGQTVGIAYNISGDLVSPFLEDVDESGNVISDSVDHARELLAALLKEGGAL